MTSAPVRQNPSRAQEAWDEHAALLLALRKAPTLANQPLFTALRMDTYERFSLAFWEAK